MWLSLFNGLDVLYHHAKFGEDRTTRAGCRCGNMVFIYFCFVFLSVFLSRSRVWRALCSGVTYFEQVLRHSLWVDFDTVVTFSQGIAVSDAINSSHFLLLGGATIFAKLRSKIEKSPKIGRKVCAQNWKFSTCFGAAFPPACTNWRKILQGQADPCAPRLC